MTQDKFIFWNRFKTLPIVETTKSQNELARKIGVAPNTVRNWKIAGATPDPATLDKLVELTGKSRAWLLGEVEDDKAHFTSEADIASSLDALPMTDILARLWYALTILNPSPHPSHRIGYFCKMTKIPVEKLGAWATSDKPDENLSAPKLNRILDALKLNEEQDDWVRKGPALPPRGLFEGYHAEDTPIPSKKRPCNPGSRKQGNQILSPHAAHLLPALQWLQAQMLLLQKRSVQASAV